MILQGRSLVRYLDLEVDDHPYYIGSQIVNPIKILQIDLSTTS